MAGFGVFRQCSIVARNKSKPAATQIHGGDERPRSRGTTDVFGSCSLVLGACVRERSGGRAAETLHDVLGQILGEGA